MKIIKKIPIHVINTVLIPISILVSCTKTEPSTINFEGSQFELPSTVREVQGALGLSYRNYEGFYRGNINNPDVTIQMDGYPIFMGSDNDSEESYYDKTVVGVTFQFRDRSMDSIIGVLETAFGVKLNAVSIQSKSNASTPPLDYRYAKTSDHLMIGVRESYNARMGKTSSNNFQVSFYKGISEDEFIEYFAPHFR